MVVVGDMHHAHVANESQPRLKCVRGDAHNIAVQLGLKAGEISREPLQRAVA